MIAVTTIIVWLPNGFDPQDPSRVDSYSRKSLELAREDYRRRKADAEPVWFLVIQSIVRDPTREYALFQTMVTEVLAAGVDEADVVLTTVETTGSPTDGLAIATFACEHPDAPIKFYASTYATARYFSVMYPAVAEHLLGYRLQKFTFRIPRGLYGSTKSKILYGLMRLATRAVAWNRVLFRAWYWLLNRAYQRRLRGFTRTVT